MTTNNFERQDIGYLLTAYADGQLAPEGVMWVEEQLDANADLRAKLKEIRQLQAGLRLAFAGGAPNFVLDLPRRDALLASAANPPRKRIRFPAPMWIGLAASVMALVYVGVLASRPVSQSMSAERGEMLADLPAMTAASEPSAAFAPRASEEQAAVAVNRLAGYASDADKQVQSLNLTLSKNDEEVAALREQNRALGGELEDRRRGLAATGGIGASPAEPELLAKGKREGFARDGADARKSFATAPASPSVPAQPAQDQLMAHMETEAKPAAKESYQFRRAPAEAMKPAAAASAAPATTTPPPAPPVVVGVQEAQQLTRAVGRTTNAPGAGPQKEQANQDAETSSTTSFTGVGGGGGGFFLEGEAKAQPTPGEQLREALARGDVDAVTVVDGVERGANNEKANIAQVGKDVALKLNVQLADAEDDYNHATAALAQLDEQKKQAAGKAVGNGRPQAATGKKDYPKIYAEIADEKTSASLPTENDSAARPVVAPRSLLVSAATIDPQRSLAALRAPVTLDGALPLAQSLRLIAGDQVGFTVGGGVDAALERQVQVSLRDEPAARGVLRVVRSVGLQAQFTGGLVTLETATRALDPSDAQGFDLPTFKDLLGTQPMQSVAVDAIQTVAIDADTASYTYAKAGVAQGQPVDPATIKPEHFINAMPMDYPAAQGPEAFTLYAEAAPSPFARAGTAWGPRTALVSIGAVAKPAAADERKPLALTLAIDCSGSMAQAGGLDRIQRGLLAFVEHLRAEDRVSIVAFGDQARVILPATPGNDRAALTNALVNLATGGATNAAEGLGLAYQLAAETAAVGVESRVLLATDGGTVAGADDLLRRVTAFKDRGITLVVVGTGQTYRAGPLQELATKGDGQHFYVGSDDDAQALFTGKLLPDRIAVLAKDAKLQVTWNPQRVSHARLIGYDQRRLAAKDFRDNTVDAGELSQDTQVTALFEVLLVDGGAGQLGTAAVRYKDMRRDQVRELACPLPGTILQSQASDRLRLLACAAATAEWLQRGWWSNVHLITPQEIAAQLARCPQPIANELRAMVK